MNREEFYITLDNKYLFFENSIINLFEDRVIKENDKDTFFWLNILKENTVFAAETGKMNPYVINKLIKDVAYDISGKLSILSKVDFIYEFERRFGTFLIIESTDKGKYLSKLKESWDFLLGKINNHQILYEDTNPANLNKTFIDKISGIVETFREKALFSLVGGIVQAGISIYFPGVGSAVISSVWGAMLFYDLYLMSIGKENWPNIIFDILGIIPGVGAVLGKTVKAIKPLISNASRIEEVGGIITQRAPQLARPLSSASKYATKIINAIKEGANWLAQKTNLKWITNLTNKSISSLNYVFDSIGKVLAPKTGRAAQIFTAKANSDVIKSAASDYAITKADEKTGFISKPINYVMSKFDTNKENITYINMTPEEENKLKNLLKKYQDE